MILFCGDTHGQFEHIIEAVQAHRPAAVILLGDVQAKRPLEVELASIRDKTEIWFIHGNHDTDSEANHDHLFGSAPGRAQLAWPGGQNRWPAHWRSWRRISRQSVDTPGTCPI